MNRKGYRKKRPDGTRVNYRRVALLAVAAGLAVLLVRGCLIARCSDSGKAAGKEGPTVQVYDHRENTLLDLPLETYILRVVAAEMPASFPSEALKAQAVAARTYAIYHMQKGGCRQHDADVCTSSACCQAYCTEARMKEKWGNDYEANYQKVRTAVLDTAGEVLLYQGDPIDALYHSASGGRTENAGDVYAQEVPYLKSVMSTAEAGTDRLTGEKSFTRSEFCDIIHQKWPQAKLSPEALGKQLAIVKTSQSGRVLSIRLNKTTLTGRQLRSALGLDSTLFTYALTENEIRFSTRGYGHGVGMSQTGANAMALGGRTYREILLYYYTDVTIGLLQSSQPQPTAPNPASEE